MGAVVPSTASGSATGAAAITCVQLSETRLFVNHLHELLLIIFMFYVHLSTRHFMYSRYPFCSVSMSTMLLRIVLPVVYLITCCLQATVEV